MTAKQMTFQASPWAKAAALVLVGLGVPLVGVGILIVIQGLNYNDAYQLGYGQLEMIIGVMVVVLAIIHVIAGIYVWRHRSWARYLGILVAFFGALLAARILPTAFDPVWTSGSDGQLINAGPQFSSLLIGFSLFPYLLVIVGLFLGGRHFKRPVETA